jgi:APA family basic amino acid/polyamine antiporter
VENAFTLAKLLLIAFFAAAGFAHIDRPLHWSASPHALMQSVLSPAFAVGIIFVSFSYSGWNGAAYLAGEIRKPGALASVCTARRHGDRGSPVSRAQRAISDGYVG